MQQHTDIKFTVTKLCNIFIASKILLTCLATYYESRHVTTKFRNLRNNFFIASTPVRFDDSLKEADDTFYLEQELLRQIP